VEAVADELMLTHPDEACDWASAAVILGAPALYLAGNALFKWSIGEALPRSHLIGLVFIAILLNFNASILVTATGAMLVLVAVALRGTRTARRAHR